MREVMRTTDPVMLSALEAELAAHGISCVVLDTHMSILEGSIGVLPRRLMVAEADGFVAGRIVDAFMADHDD